MPSKAKTAFRTISEVATWLDVPAHVLRFWESKFPQIKPVKRAGGRRYYRPEDMQLIGGIKALLHDDGITIRGVQKRIKEDGLDAICALSPDIETPGDTARTAPKAEKPPKDIPAPSVAETPDTSANVKDSGSDPAESSAIDPLLAPPHSEPLESAPEAEIEVEAAENTVPMTRREERRAGLEIKAAHLDDTTDPEADMPSREAFIGGSDSVDTPTESPVQSDMFTAPEPAEAVIADLEEPEAVIADLGEPDFDVAPEDDMATLTPEMDSEEDAPHTAAQTLPNETPETGTEPLDLPQEDIAESDPDAPDAQVLDASPEPEPEPVPEDPPHEEEPVLAQEPSQAAADTAPSPQEDAPEQGAPAAVTSPDLDSITISDAQRETLAALGRLRRSDAPDLAKVPNLDAIAERVRALREEMAVALRRASGA